MFAAACTPRIDTRGNLPDPERLAEVRVGEFTRDDVMDAIGSPSSVSNFSDDTWYYISKRTETTAFFAPEITNRKVIAVQFDAKGVVKAVDVFGLEKGREVQVVERETPTSGHQLTLIEQLFGNLGRFNKGGPVESGVLDGM